MTDLETFRTETRAWLEANCPAEMRQPVKGDDDICWGGRNWVFSSPAQKQWLEVEPESHQEWRQWHPLVAYWD